MDEPSESSIPRPSADGSSAENSAGETPEALGWPVKIGVWLVWLSVGLPVSAVLFLGVPAFGALLVLVFLSQAGVPPDQLVGPWLTPEPWFVLGAIGIRVHHRASHRHRLPPREPGAGRRIWVLVGVVGTLGMVAVVGLEVIPRTDLHPAIHYAVVSSALGWWVLSLAYLSGRGFSALAVSVERWALSNRAIQGALVATGPMSMIAVAAVVSTNVIHEVIETVAQESLGSAAPTTGGAGPEQPSDFNQCLLELYGPPDPSQFTKAAIRVNGYGVGVDGEDVAAETALAVCFKGGRRGQSLERYYARSVSNRANTARGRGRRSIDSCDFSWGPGLPGVDSDMEDCLRRQLCALSASDQEALRLNLLGYTDSEVADDLELTKSAAQKRVRRSRQRFVRRAREACGD